MSDYQDLEMSGARSEEMKKKLEQYVDRGVSRQLEMLKVVTARKITNKLPLPHTLEVCLDPLDGKTLVLRSLNADEPKQEFSAPLHDNALQQLVSNPPDIKLSIRDIRWFLEGEFSRRDLVPTIFNRLFRNEKFYTGQKTKRIKRFLVRIVKEANSEKEEIRAFLSDKFGVTFDTRELLRAFVESCAQLHAGPVSAYHSDIQTSLTCCLPYVFEPVDKSFIALGVNFTNSDFGRGVFAISTVAYHLSGGTSSILAHDFSRRHIGSVLQCTELESSVEFKKAEIAAQSQAVRDLVPRALNRETVKNTLELIQFAHEKQIPWYQADKWMTTVANLKQADRERVRTLLSGPPMPELPSVSVDKDGDPQANAWWLANAVGWLANNGLEDRQHDLEVAAGKLLGEVGAE